MRTVRLRLHVPHKSASDLYATLANFELYPTLCDAVQNVVVTELSGNLIVSRWDVTFRAGLLRWTEEDTFDPGALTITFRQLEGDIAVFDGSWQCVHAAQGSEVLFTARLDMGIPSLDKYLSEIPLLELEKPGHGALQKFRELGGPALLVPAEHEGKGASMLD